MDKNEAALKAVSNCTLKGKDPFTWAASRTTECKMWIPFDTAILFHGLRTTDGLPQMDKDICKKKMFFTVVYWHGERGNNLNSINKDG